MMPLTSPQPPFHAYAAGTEGGMSGAGAMLRWHLSTMPIPPPRSPLSRSAGAGLGVRAALTFPPALLPTRRESMLAPSHDGHKGTGHAQREIWVFDQALSCFG